MFEFVKQMFISAMIIFSCNLPSVNSLKCISFNNQKCKIRPKIVNVNSDEPIFYHSAICGILAVITLAISVGTGAYFAYSRWYLKKDVTLINFGTRIQWDCVRTAI